jgi:hypothetical protein
LRSVSAVAVAGIAALSLVCPGSRVSAAEVIPHGLDLSAPARELCRSPSVLLVQAGGRHVEVGLSLDHPLCAAGSAHVALKKIRLFARLLSEELSLPSLAYRLESMPLLWSLDASAATMGQSVRGGDRLLTSNALRLEVIDWPASLAVFLRELEASRGTPPLRLVSLQPLPAVRTQVFSEAAPLPAARSNPYRGRP